MKTNMAYKHIITEAEQDLYTLNAQLSIYVAKNKGLNLPELMVLNVRLGSIIKKLRGTTK